MKTTKLQKAPKAPRIIKRRPSEPAAGFVGGAVVGAAAGVIAGPAGVVLGALTGGVVGGITGVIMEEEEARRSRKDIKLDEDLGVESGDIGVAPVSRGASMAGSWEEELDIELESIPPPPPVEPKDR